MWQRVDINNKPIQKTWICNISIYTYIYHVHTLFPHVVVHFDQFSSVFLLFTTRFHQFCLTYLIILSKEFEKISKPVWWVYQKTTCVQSICSFYHWISSAVLNFPKPFLQLNHYSRFFGSPKFSSPIVHVIIGFHQFSSPISIWVHHDSLIFFCCSFIVSLDFINFPHQIRHCTIRLHQCSLSYILAIVFNH